MSVTLTDRVHRKPASTPQCLMLFDLALGGHHGSYIQHLVQHWCQAALPGEIHIVVSPQFLTVHRETVAALSDHQNPRIHLIPISAEDETALAVKAAAAGRLFRKLQEWRLFCKYAQIVQADRALLMYLDTCDLPLALGTPAPCPVSGIYFRPTFHYRDFVDYRPSLKQQVQHWREQLVLGRLLKHPQLQTVFCLDPFAVSAIQQFRSQASVVHLPDPVQTDLDATGDGTANLAALQTRLAIQPGRRVFLMLGALESRKGVYQLLDAVQQLPSELSRKLCLVLVGGTHPVEQTRIQHQVAQIRQNHDIQIIEQYEFISDGDVLAYFQLADVVLTPYQQHVGMSGILLLAAAAGKPVLSSNYGLMGEIVRRYRLGLTVDSTQPGEIAQGLVHCLETPADALIDRRLMKALATANSVDQYTSTLLQQFYPDCQIVAGRAREPFETEKHSS